MNNIFTKYQNIKTNINKSIKELINSIKYEYKETEELFNKIYSSSQINNNSSLDYLCIFGYITVTEKVSTNMDNSFSLIHKNPKYDPFINIDIEGNIINEYLITKLDLSSVDYILSENTFIYVKGLYIGDVFQVNNVFTGECPSRLSIDKENAKDNVRVIMASGPFHIDNKISPQLCIDTINRMYENNADVYILIGPIVSNNDDMFI